MDKIIKPLTFVTAQELDPLTAQFLNARFVGFLSRFCYECGIDFCDAAGTAQKILREAEIPQAGDELLQGPAPDLSAFEQ